jgi:hypothetical protein
MYLERENAINAGAYILVCCAFLGMYKLLRRSKCCFCEQRMYVTMYIPMHFLCVYMKSDAVEFDSNEILLKICKLHLNVAWMIDMFSFFQYKITLMGISMSLNGNYSNQRFILPKGQCPRFTYIYTCHYN